MTAVARALHCEGPPPHVLVDPLALSLAGDEGTQVREQLETSLSPAALEVFSRWCGVRTRFAEDVVERELRERGTRQYVILGAGLDTFAQRRHDLLTELRVFEVDHPATQEWKRARLQQEGLPIPDGLVFTPVDFERESLADGLRAAGFDFASPAVFAWIGVTMFLTFDAIASTLAFVASLPSGTHLVLTYNLPDTALGGLGASTQGALSEVTSGMGEPMITFFTPADIEQLLSDHGFGGIVHVGPDEARSMYFDDRADIAFGGAQRIVAATVRPSRSQGNGGGTGI